MPRPKRTKVAPSMAASHSTNSTSDPQPATISSEDLYGVSDQDTANGGISHSPRVSKAITSSRPQSVVSKASAMNEEHAKALENLKRRRDAAMQRLEAENLPSATEASSEQPMPVTSEATSSSPAIEVGRRERTTPVKRNPLPGPFRKRARQSSILGRRGFRGRSSSVEADVPGDHEDTRVPRSVLRQGTFKRRERQPSILGRRESRVRSRSVGQDTDGGMASNTDQTLKGGHFKRRSRQPSILGANRNRGVGGGYDDTDDFNPEDESTPLKLQKATPSRENSQPASSVNSRKRKISPIHISSDSPSEDELPTDNEEPTNLPSPSHEAPRTATPEILSETLAPPQSSSSSAPSPMPLRTSRRTNIQPRHAEPTPATRRQPSRKAVNDDPPSSPPSLTYSPNQKTAPSLRQSKQKPQPASFSTADLQTLLPRRRRRAPRDSFDILSSDEDVSDEDDLSHMDARSSRRTPAPSRRVTKLKSAAKSTGKRSKASHKHTYGTRHDASDKENETGSGEEFENEGEIDPDDSLGPMREESPETSQELVQKIGKELKDAKRKFQDVDKWELEFEEVTASSSSPADAR